MSGMSGISGMSGMKRLGEPRYVITAAGAIGAPGVGHDFFAGLSRGRHLPVPVAAFADAGLPVHHAYAASTYSAGALLGMRGLRTLDRSARLICGAAHLCLAEAGTAGGAGLDGDSTGVVTATAFGSVASIAAFDRASLEEHPNYVNPADFPNTTINTASSQVGIRWGLKALNCTISNGFSASLDAFFIALRYMADGFAAAVLVGGVEELSVEALLGFYHQGALAPDGEPARPFAPGRRGVVLGEGAAVLLVAPAVGGALGGRTALAIVAGFGTSFEPGGGVVATGIARAMRAALDDARVTPGEVDVVVAAAAGSPAGDAAEAAALSDVFASGERPAVYAVKGAVGECYGAGGALAAAAAVHCMREGVIPPSPNAGALDWAPGSAPGSTPGSTPLRVALINAWGCDGRASSLVLTAPG